MKQLVFAEPGKLEWQDAQDPVPPFPVGHEIAAEVLDVGPGVTRVKPGQRVAVPFQVSCGTCTPCNERHYAACEPNQARAGAAFGFGESGGGHGGGVADLLLVPAADHMLLAAPESISDVALATTTDNLIDAYRTVVDGLRERPGADVLIVGGDAPSISVYADSTRTRCPRTQGSQPRFWCR